MGNKVRKVEGRFKSQGDWEWKEKIEKGKCIEGTSGGWRRWCTIRDDVQLGARVYRPSLVKCRSTVIYLSRIDASPEVNGRVVTISRWTGQSVRTANSRVCESSRAREYANIRAVWGLLHGPTRCSLSLSTMVPATIFSHEPLNYFARRSNKNDRSMWNEASWYEWATLIFSFLMWVVKEDLWICWYVVELVIVWS